MAEKSRTEARKLQKLPIASRRAILNSVADALVERSAEILEANEVDVREGESGGLDVMLLRRLKMTKEKVSDVTITHKLFAAQNSLLVQHDLCVFCPSVIPLGSWTIESAEISLDAKLLVGRKNKRFSRLTRVTALRWMYAIQ